MENADPLEGAWRKLQRARGHLRALSDEAEAFRDNSAPMYSFRKELSPETGTGRYVVLRVREFPREWALIIGDVLNNSRTALDHLAWLLVRTGATPTPPKPQTVQFPICTTAEGFSRSVPKRLPGVRSEFIEMVKNRQPIPGSRHFATFGCLADLVALNNVDKHRELHSLVGLHTASAASVVGTTDFELTELRYSQDSAPLPLVMRPGLELLVFHGRVTGPAPDVEIRLQGVVKGTFEDGKPVTEVLVKIVHAVDQLLGAFDGAL